MQKGHRTDRQKVGSGVLGAWVEMHNSLIAACIYYLFTLHLLSFL
jgi:hypothetical protein